MVELKSMLQAILEKQQMTNAKLDALTERVSGLESGMDRLQSRIDKLESRMDKLEFSMDRLEAAGRSVKERTFRFQRGNAPQFQQFPAHAESIRNRFGCDDGPCQLLEREILNERAAPKFTWGSPFLHILGIAAKE
ncbi:hypothetical protein [Paenibacillus alkalitolerans]|uniref:hypothetical protein n=1 Tax=Paenibacillus alkalitolerans TaxID=2799335 RepID=UPI0018F4491E|nr:hypothetical protein [Paenibacillus alkalitolerans]